MIVRLQITILHLVRTECDFLAVDNKTTNRLIERGYGENLLKLRERVQTLLRFLSDKFILRSLPDVLDTPIMHTNLTVAKMVGLISEDGKWVGSNAKLAAFAFLMNKTDDAMKEHPYLVYYKPFEDYFGVKGLSKSFNQLPFSDVRNPSGDDLKTEIRDYLGFTES